MHCENFVMYLESNVICNLINKLNIFIYIKFYSIYRINFSKFRKMTYLKIYYKFRL